MTNIDLNADVGEDFPFDGELFEIISSANISCGTHAGDPALTGARAAQAAAADIRVGAHPSYPDRMNFGRTSMPLTDKVIDSFGAQIETFIEASPVHPAYIKPHGALYNDAYRDTDVAEAVVSLGRWYQVPIMGQRGGEVERLCHFRGVEFISEVFADRAYNPDGTLVSRTLPGAVLHVPAVIASRVVSMVLLGKVEAADGSTMELSGESICLHGDNPDSVAIARAVRAALEVEGIIIAA